MPVGRGGPAGSPASSALERRSPTSRPAIDPRFDQWVGGRRVAATDPRDRPRGGLPCSWVRPLRFAPWTPTTDARAAIAALQGHEAWAIIRRSTRAGDRDTVGLVGGRRARGRVAPRRTARGRACPPTATSPTGCSRCRSGRSRERGFEAHDDGTPLVVVDVETELEFSVAEVVDAIDDTGVEFADRGGFDTDDEEYGKLVEAIIRDEIGQGEGANLVIGRHYRATVADWGADKALTVFRRLLERERGAYWTYLFFTGDRYLVGASPERHVSIHGGDVRMNPISGTFRIPRDGLDAEAAAPRLPRATRRRSTSSSWSSTRSSR